ncbi:MAG: 2-oxo acid dehydrogenase subunit E2 [Clostridia bacterium]|nr:2-oxo acid dehydrogenase subunit E2 [Clostridia bacterium]
MRKMKKARGDRKDAKRLRGQDAMHVFTPYLLPRRTDNEAFVTEDIDLTAINAFLAEKNSSNPAYKYTIFHVVVAALAKTIYQRPKMNRFIQGHRLYERNDILLSFVAKRLFTDDGEEALILLKCDKDSTIDFIHDEICTRVSKTRKEGTVDDTTQIMNMLARLPRFLLRFIVRTLNFLEYHDWLPDFLRYADPYHSTVFVSNLGSIKLNSGYHHLTNWGTTSLFVVIGEKHFAPVYAADGSFQVREVLPLGITLDERIADGYYYAKSIQLFKHYLLNPQLLDLPASEKAEI